ncbi:hypothetical protein [Hymenobacter sedentarius]|uniref:hypothetical protein n=1 Tax=Hymenobacter sedentarius TaxID=1411621 RepID=UPI000B260B4D|nr:hypothetical protein [Hymenobacter sedentarius]
MPYSKTTDDFKADLADQINFLKMSCQAYDNGAVVEGKRLALALRILLFDGRNRSRSVALLTRLDLKERLLYHSVTREIDKSVTNRFYSFELSTSEGHVHCKPHLGRPQLQLPFAQWWDQTIMQNHELSVSRRDIIMSLADQDGGAHVDTKLDGDYGDLAKLQGSGIRFDALSGLLVVAPAGVPYEGKYELLLARQIAHEVLSTFDEQLDTLLTNC